ncbi:MAG: outer membrane protein transport protein [Verrucomicrobia bacterium]|nr:outer membrane protein transport protein [Verrucomicrobiota bacterium]
MDTQCNRAGLKILIFLTLGAIVQSACADGYRNPPPTAEGIGKSGANMVFVDDASAISYNPANLGMQTNRSLVVAATFARTETTYSPFPGVSVESDGDWNVLPNLYYSQPIGEKGWVAGIGINTPYGQGVSWNASDFAPGVALGDTVPYEASVLFLNINPTIAFPVHESVYIGVGLDVVYSKLELKALNGVALNPLPPPPVIIVPSEGDGDGWGIGGNIGVTWLPTSRQRVAVTYRSRVDIDYKGDFEVGGAGAGDFETTIKYPNIIGLGYGIQLTDDIQLETQVEWLQWSVNDTQTLVTGPASSPIVNNWDDTFTLGFGGSWAVTDSLVARAGYAFIPSPIPDATVTHLLADEDRHALSLGVGYAFGSHLVDLAYTFSIYDDRDSTPSGAYEVDSNLIGMTYSLSF